MNITLKLSWQKTLNDMPHAVKLTIATYVVSVCEHQSLNTQLIFVPHSQLLLKVSFVVH